MFLVPVFGTEGEGVTVTVLNASLVLLLLLQFTRASFGSLRLMIDECLSVQVNHTAGP